MQYNNTRLSSLNIVLSPLTKVIRNCLLLLSLVLTSFFVAAKGVPPHVAKVNANVLPESNYPYWPAYNSLALDDLTDIKAQPWINQQHTIDGWDWSLPESVTPADNGLVALQRNIGLKKSFKALKLSFPSNSVGILWVKWRDIEATEGNFDFSPIVAKIKQANSVGVEVILRILAHSKDRAGNINKGDAPLWLEKYDVTLLKRRRLKDNLNFDPAHPVFHDRYLKLVQALAKTDIPNMVKAAYVGYRSNSFGDEGIGPFKEHDWQKNDALDHVRERLDAWQKAFTGMEHKVFMGGTSHYGFKQGFGVRRGFVEMYLYNIPNADMGQYIDINGYLMVDESAPIIKNGGFHGEVNEEYEAGWATAKRGYRFGETTNSYPYRYFVSTLRALQMRCNYIHTTGHLVPQMLPFLSLELGRTVHDAPDTWSYLSTSYLKS